MQTATALSPEHQKLLEQLRASGVKPPQAVVSARKAASLGCVEHNEKYFYIPETGRPIKYEDHQKIILNIIAGTHNYPTLLDFYSTVEYSCPKKEGKALDIETLIPTADGWKTMEEIQEGDEVFDEKGSICNVVYATEIMYNRKCYEVTFSDGSTIIADAEHLWQVEEVYNTHKTFILTTEELIPTYKTNGGSPKWRIPLAEPLRAPQRHLLVDPYVLGVWLGDGSSASARLTCCDPQILEEIELAGVSVYETKHPNRAPSYQLGSKGIHQTREEGKNSLHYKLRELEVLNNKHIPWEYLRASVQQRLALLQGLMDTDGTIDTIGKSCEFSVTNERLAQNFLELTLSLGFKARMRSGPAKLNGQQYGTRYRIVFHAPKDIPVFRLDRKAARQRERSTSEHVNRSITDIRQIYSVPVKCIEVDSPSHLYLAGPTFIPTHNTATSGGYARHRAEQTTSRDEILFFANDETQSRGRAYAAIQVSIELDPRYDVKRRELIDADGNVVWRIIEDFIEHVPTNTKVRAVNVDYRGEAGANPSLTVWCVDQNTEILTDKGWVTYDKFDLNCKVATRNPKHGAFEWQQPRAVNIKNYTGPMLATHGRQIDMVVTPNHRLWGRTGKGYVASKKGPMQFIPAIYACDNSHTNIPDAFSAWQPSNLEDYMVIDRRVAGLNAISNPLVIDMRAFCLFMGWFISEGCTHKDEVIISQKDTSPSYNEILQIIKGCGFDYKIWTSRGDGLTSIVIHNAELARYCHEFGLSHEKFVPPEIKESKYLNLFFSAYIKGDGHKELKANRIRALTTSPKLRDDLEEIGLKLGYWVSCSPSEDLRSDHFQYQLKFYDGHEGLHEHCVQNWSIEEYDGVVWCPSTENGIITVRRNNKVYQTGNTECWGYDTDKQLKLFEEMTPVLTRFHSQRYLEGYAGYTGKSKVQEYVENLATKPELGGRQLTRDDIPDWPFPDEDLLPLYVNDSAGVFAYLDRGPIARTRMPWLIGPEADKYYVEQSLTLTPEQFDRLHNNYWVSPTEAFIPIEWWNQCQDDSIPELVPSKEPLTHAPFDVSSVPHVDDPNYQSMFAQYIDPSNWRQLETSSNVPLVLSCDASVSGDCTALTLTSRHPQRYNDVALRLALKWDPPRGGKIDYERTPNQVTGLSLWQQIIDLCVRYNVVQFAYDEWQMHHLVNQLRNLGIVWCRAFGQSTPRDIADKQLYDLIKLRRIGYSGNAHLIDSKAMTEHLQNASRQQRAKEDTKLHIVKSSEDRKIDLTVSLSMGCAECLRLDM